MKDDRGINHPLLTCFVPRFHTLYAGKQSENGTIPGHNNMAVHYKQ